MDKNFAGQNLNGRSFRGQDLRGADFSGCQLKSCDFRDADLTDAKFCRATMSINGQRIDFKWILAFILGFICGCLVWILNIAFVIVAEYITTFLNQIDILGKNFGSGDYIWIGLFCAVYVSLSLLSALKYRNWRIVGWYYLAAAIMGVATAAIFVISDKQQVFQTLIVAEIAMFIVATGVTALAITAAKLISVAVATAGALAGTTAGVGMAVGAGAVAATTAALQKASGDMSFNSIPSIISLPLSVMIISFIYVLLGNYLNRRAMQSEEPMLSWLRRYALMWRCLGSTQFSGAKLSHTDFTEADLTAAQFANAQFQQPNFTRAKNLRLAWTYATALEHPAVRTLMTEGRIDHRDFSNLHLRGLSFKGLNLTGCNFYHADLSEVDFTNCDLTVADLSETMVYGTSFNHAKMTGAIIENWDMDKHTQFEGVVCEFVYTQRRPCERNPPDGTFKPGEFSKLYQEIANTVDFIAHSPDELQALLRAIDHIKQQGGDIVVQSLERKHESVVVRTQSDENIDKAAIYAEVKAQTEKELLVLQQEKKLLLQKVEMQEQHTDTLKALLNKAIESPKIMNDNSRHYGNITAKDSAVNLGDASTVSNHIEQVVDAELKVTLQTLLQLLASSHLPAIDKQEAHKAVDELAAVSHKPEAERKNLARRSVAFLKDLHGDLTSVAELSEQYGKLLAKIIAWF